MEKDARRGHREWRGCYSFKDITCDGDSANLAKRNGGLKMGQTYYYYVRASQMNQALLGLSTFADLINSMK